MRAYKTGQYAEQRACRYLAHHGLSLIVRNFRSRSGEIDLIMRDQRTLVFVEVRYRQSCAFGTPLESVTLSKQRRLIQTAAYFLCAHKRYAVLSPRFDVVGLTGDNYKLEAWVKHAFDYDGF